MPSRAGIGSALATGVHDRERAGVLHPRWIVVLLVLLTVGLFWPTLVALTHIWVDVADYQYAVLTAGIAVWMLYRESGFIDARQIQPRLQALPLLGLALLAWMVSWRANSDMLQQVLFPIVLLLSVAAAMGWHAARTVAFPIAYFFFSIPIWDHFVPVLQWLTTQAAENILGVLGVPTNVDGHHVTIPAGRFSIIEGCSGKRYFVVGLSFAALAGWLQCVRGKKLIYLLGVSAVIAILTNWLRVVTVIYAGHLSDMQHYFVAVEHKSLGYALFLPMLFLIGWLARRLGDDESVLSGRRAALATLSLPQVVRYAAGPSLLLIGCLLWLTATRATADMDVKLGSFPLMVGPWQGPLPPDSRWQPSFTGSSAEGRASYADSQGRVDVYVNAYGVQRAGSELVFHANSVAPTESWTSIDRWHSSQGLQMSIASHAAYGRWLFASTYVVGGRATSSGVRAQLLYGWSALGDPAASGVVAFAVPCGSDCSSEARRIEDLWSKNGRELREMVPAGRNEASDEGDT